MKKARADASGLESADVVDPPPRYELWKAARTRSDGQMTSRSARGRDDILTQAIGRPNTRDVFVVPGGSWGLRDYFGALPRRTSTADSYSQEALQTMQRDFEDKLNTMRHEMEQKMEEKIASLGRLQQQTTLPEEGVRVSTKGSYSAADPSGEQPATDLPGLCELYIEDDPPRLVAIGRVFEGGSTIHGVPLLPRSDAGRR
ncbi:hypothetical protein Fmac_028210 [Flemingia macrophylla]|uniref:Uncharacterized protein n=1 Tax=Flemingia macrophylla TaxID=520843 RepID=A0ABD1L6V2_9FABA